MQPNKEYTFENYITGESNLSAVTAAKAAAENPGRVHNPLFIYAGSSLGKTHLLNAVYNHIRAHSPELSVAMYSAAELIEQMISAKIKGQTETWRALLQADDVLLIDDMHVAAGKESTQAEFCELLRCFTGSGKQVVITFSEPLNNFQVICSAFPPGRDLFTLAEILPLDTDTCRMLINSKAAQAGLILSEETQEYIIAQSSGEPRRAIGSIARLRAEKVLL